MSAHDEPPRVALAGPRDDLAILNLYRDVFSEDRWFITTGDEFGIDLLQMRARIDAHHASDSSGVWVARAARGVVCDVLFATGGRLQRTRHTSKIEIMVARPWRGRGVGRSLLEGCIAWAEESPVVEKLGLAVFADNPTAMRLYERCGFVEEGRRVREYRMEDGSYRDDILMYRTTR